jgi:hypothetical protein
MKVCPYCRSKNVSAVPVKKGPWQWIKCLGCGHFLMLALLLLTITVTGCGTADSATDTETSLNPENSESEAPVTAKGSVTALAIKDLASAPDCDLSGLLIYLLDTAEFRVCDGKDWVAIDIKGPKGDKGEDGAVAQQQTVTTPPDNVWVDQMTGKWWLHGGNGPFNTGACIGDYRAPTEAEISAAVDHGLIAGFRAKGYTTLNYWTSNVGYWAAFTFARYFSETGMDTAPKTNAFGRLCVKI